MKKHGGTGKKMVMFALLAVLLISLGFLSKQVKEGMEKMEEDKVMEEEDETEDEVQEGMRKRWGYTPPPSRNRRQAESDLRAAQTIATMARKITR
jgi:hypothetical protein